MDYYIMKKAERFYREAMAKHGLANAVSPMIEDIVFDIVEKMEMEDKEIERALNRELEGLKNKLNTIQKENFHLKQKNKKYEKELNNPHLEELCCGVDEECPRCSDLHEGCPPSNK
jgi:hypothetical protein